MQLSALLETSIDRSKRLAVLAVVPFLTSLLRWRDVEAVASDSSTVYSVTFGTPHPFLDLWTFVNAPTPETGDAVGTADFPLLVAAGFGLLFVASLVGFVVVSGLLLAGYLGSIDEGGDGGEFDFLGNVISYGRSLVGYQALSLGVVVGLVLAAGAVPAMAPLVFVAVFVLAYLFYLTPYLVVVRDRGLVVALRESFGIVTSRLEPVVAFVGFTVCVAVASVPVSWIAYEFGFPGVVAAAAVTAPVGFFATVFFLEFAGELAADGRTYSNVPADM